MLCPILGAGLCWVTPNQQDQGCSLQQGWRGCRTPGVPCSMPVPAPRAQPATGTGTTADPAMPRTHKESPQPLTKDIWDSHQGWK